MSQLFPASIPIEQKDSTEISSAMFGSFRPILSTRLARNLLSNDDQSTPPLMITSSTSNQSSKSNDSFSADEHLPISTLFFSISGSTYHRQSDINSNRFRLSMTPTIFEQFHEVKFLSDRFIQRNSLLDFPIN